MEVFAVRMWTEFCEPVAYSGMTVRKIMVYRKPEGETCVFLYPTPDAQICCADEWYPDVRAALAAWDGVPHTGWTEIGDPLPGCQEDAFEPVRVKGRADGDPQWGTFEILRDGAWQPYAEQTVDFRSES